MRIFHLMSNDKFIPPFIKFINDNFNSKEHEFCIFGGKEYQKIEASKKNVKIYINNYKKYILKILYYIVCYIKIFFKMIESDKIILHGLFNTLTIIFLFFNPWFLKKSYWVIWGGDLYSYKKRKKKLLNKIYYKMETYVKGNCKGYITHIYGDYELARKWYGASGKYYYSFMYLSNVYRKIELEEKLNIENLNIQIGNSADPSNNHMEILERLKKYRNKNIKLYCILSYGDREWIKKVINKGKELFKEKFIPITEFLSYEDYLKLLTEIDIAIFAHNRQQGVGNITSLLGMGKTVYLKKSVTTYEMFRKLGVELKEFDKMEKLEILSLEKRKMNKIIIEENFTEKKLKKSWKNIFEGD